jgi:muramoyltetrapeptide carboxypeptidase LdcA involved in peptidoglycan recycling
MQRTALEGLLRPSRLRPDDVIGVATPSSPVGTPRRLRRGVEALHALGYQVRLGPVATSGGGSRAERVAELNSFLRDPAVRCVVMSIGGFTSNALLDDLDYDALRADPKVIVGYSDITTILLAVLARAGVVTFHGPTLLPELAEYPHPLSYTTDAFTRAVGRPQPLGRLAAAPGWTEELLMWDEADDRARSTRASGGWRWLQGGTGTGPLLGGNLETLGVLAGTPYLPDFDGAVVLLETTSVDLNQIDRTLTHLEMIGIFDRMRGLLVGRPFRAPAGFTEAFTDHIGQRFAGRDVPVVAMLDIGHTDPMLTLPLGVRARVDSGSGTVEVLDAAVV